MTFSGDFLDSEARRLGHKLGWRYLTCPQKMIETASVALITTNPAGASFERGKWSVEGGNAYEIESWGRPPGQYPLQVQVRRMFQVAKVKLDDVLSGYFVPFRSPNWESLSKKEESVEVGKRLWMEVLKGDRLKTIIAFGKSPIDLHLPAMLAARLCATPAAGWGDQTIDVYRFGERGKLLLLPHLSRFALFNRDKSEAAFLAAYDLP